jgi:CheY-like chemotaxis protein
VDGADNGQTAVDKFSQRHHAVLVMDLSMSVMDGQKAFQAIERLCKERNWEMPAVLFCTGYVPPGSLSEILAHSNIHGLLLKPVSGLDVAKAVLSRLRR